MTRIETGIGVRHAPLWTACLWALPALAFAITAAGALFLGGEFPISDERSYLDYANAWAAHGDFLIEQDGKQIRSLFWPPLWPILLSYVGQVAPGPLAARLFNAALLAITLHLIARICRARGDIAPLAFVAAAGLYLPVAVYTAVLILPQTLCAVFLALSLLIVSSRSRIRAWPVVLGVVAGLLGLANLTLVPGVLCGLLFLVISRDIRFHQLVAVTLIAIAIPSTWIVRNQVVHGHAVFSTNSGLNLALGNSPGTTPGSGVRVDLSGAIPPGAKDLDEFEINTLYTRYALQNIAADPLHYAGLYFRKLLNWFAFTNQFATQGLTTFWKDALAFVTYYGLLGLSLLFLLRGRPMARRELLYPVGVYVGAALFYSLFFVRVRFRVPLDALLIPLAALGLQVIVAWWTAKQSPPQAE